MTSKFISRVACLMLLLTVIFLASGFDTISESPADKKKELAHSLFQAYELADCDSEQTFRAAYESVTNAAAPLAPAVITECNQVNNCNGDAEQFTNGNNYVNCTTNASASDLEIGFLGNNPNLVGMHWTGWNVPAGATIISAHAQFTALDNSRGAASFTIRGEADPNPAIFDAANDIVSRTGTVASVPWTPGTWVAGASGAAQMTPDLTAIIQEIVNQPGYAQGNPIVLGISGKGARKAVPYDIDPAASPELCITYEIPDPPSVTCEECPDVSVISLDGIPNFPQVDLLNVCSAPDTAAIMIYNDGLCPIKDVKFKVIFDSGLSYGGFVMNDMQNTSSGTVMPFDLSDPTQPIFIVDVIDSSQVFITDFAIQTDCNVDVEQEADLNFDIELEYNYDDDSGVEETCNFELTEIGAYNSGVKIPVLNVLSVTPSELTITNTTTPFCQEIVISQDGIEAFLDQFSFSIAGLDTNFYQLSSIAVNGIAMPASDYSYNAASQTVNAAITGTYFPPNTGAGSNGDEFFDTDERLVVEVCYTVDGCLEEAAFLNYNAFYGCNDDICFGVTSGEGALEYAPDFGATVVATSNNIMYGGICGDDLAYDITITSTNSDPLEGLWQDLLVKYNACLGNGMTISGIQVNGVEIDASLWSNVGSTLEIDFSLNTDPSLGLTDEDGGGTFNDLVGGQALTFTTMISIGCSESMSGCDGSIACNLETIEVNGKRNCGQGFQQFANIGDPVNFFYGELGSSDNTMIISPYSIPITEVFVTTANIWNPTANGYEYSYQFGLENIEPCANPGDVYMLVNVQAAGARIKHIRYEPNTATYQGVPVPGTTSSYVTITTASGALDTTALEIIIPMGDINAVNHDYYFNLEYEGFCAPNDYAYMTYTIVEECMDCGDVDPCRIVRSCGDAATYIDWRGIDCPCFIEGCIGDIYRTNYGFADKEMTQQLTRDDVPEADQIRFIPGDTMYYSAEFKINEISELQKADYLWYLRIYNNYNAPAGKVMWDINHAELQGWYWYDDDTGVKTEIGIPDCFLDYPIDERDNYYSPGIRLMNMGAESYGSDYDHPTYGAADQYGNCKSDENINPTYDPDYVIYNMANMSSTDWAADQMRFEVWWGRHPDCPWTGGLTETGTSEDHVNPCFDEFWEQFPMANNDKIIIEMKVPMIHNPAYDLDQLNGTMLSQATNIWPSFLGYTVDEATCGTTTVLGSCNKTEPIQTHLPGPVSVTNEVVVEDCETIVEYDFILNNPVPTDLADGELPWFENEYRPYFATEYLNLMFPNNMVYLGDGVIIMPDGSEVVFPPEYIDDGGNLVCIDDPAGTVCCTAADTNSLASLKLIDEQYIEGTNTPYGWGPNGPNESGDYCDVPALVHKKNDPFPHLMVGGTEQCSYGIRYSLSALCPEDVESTDFRLDYQFAEPYIPTLARQRANSYFGNIASAAGVQYLNTSYYWLFPNNPYGEGCSAAIDEGCQSYFQNITTDPDTSPGSINPMRQTGSIITGPDDFTDNSQDFPPLMATLANLLKSDLAGVSEFNTYEVCAGTVGGAGTHTNVVTSIEVPNAVDFLNAFDAVGAPLVWTVAATTPTSTIYAVENPDLAPGECATVEIETELLFCPVGMDIETKICVSTVSGCVEAAKAAQLSATGGSCDAVSACYEYIAEEAEIQSEWIPNAMGEYGLCETIPLGIRIKNVRPSVLVDVVSDWWFPAGLSPVSGSWQVCYPGGSGPNGGGNTGPCVAIPVGDEPVLNGAQNSVYGTNYSWDEDALMNSFIDMNGFPGVKSSLDSNKVQILFEVETVCDEFTSGTRIYYQTQAADPCEATVFSQFIESDPIIIKGANPADFAQFFVVAEPTTANCGGVATIDLTFLNISPFGESDESIVCMDLESSTFDYMPGSFAWVSPGSHMPTITETMNGNLTHVCFNIPDGIGPGEAFKIQFDFEVPEDIPCGDVDLGVAVSSEVMDVGCMATGEECSVQVLNSVNPVIQIDFAPPIDILDQNLTVGCPNADGEVDVCYEVILDNNVNPYSGEIELFLIRDLNGNGQLDAFDPPLDSMTTNVTLAVGDMDTLMGCFMVDEAISCPVFLKVMQMTNCVCDEDIFYFDSMEPDIVNKLGDSYALCPGAPLIIENCGTWDYDASPFAGATVTTNAAGDSVYVDLQDGFGITSPVILTITSQAGGCMPFSFPIELWSLSSFEFPVYEPMTVCSESCTELDLGLPEGYMGSVGVLWSPADYLDDPTSLYPVICNPDADITYTVSLTFMEGNQTCIFDGPFPITVEEQTMDNSFEDGNLCNPSNATITAPTGYTNYAFTMILPDGTTTVPQSGSSNTFVATQEATYYVEYWNLGDICRIKGNEIMMAACISIDKEFVSAIPTANANEYTVTYTIEVTNPSIFATDYDLYDMPAFNDNVTILTGSFTSDVPSSGALTTAPASPGDQIGNDVVIPASGTQTYTVTYVVVIDPIGDNGGTGDGTYESCGQGAGPASAGPGEGLYNVATLDTDDDLTTDEGMDDDCGELPYLTMSKDTISLTSLGDDCYEALYLLTVENLGGAMGMYDLVDMPQYDADFIVNTVTYTTTATGNIGGGLIPTSPTWVLADDQGILPSVIDSFWLTVIVCLDLMDGEANDTYDSSCGGGGASDPSGGQGLFNQAALDVNNDGMADVLDTVCMDVPVIELDKTFDGYVLLSDGTYDVTYTIEVCNTGGMEGQYDLYDIPGYDPDIIINSASFTSDVPSGTTLTVPVPTGGWMMSDDETLNIGLCHTYTLVVNVTADLTGAAPGGDGAISDCGGDGTGPIMPGEGLYNEAYIDTDNDGEPNDEAETCGDLEIFDLAMIKTVNASTPGPYGPGSTVTFDLTVYNQGSEDAYNVGLNDYFDPAELVLADAAWTLSSAGVAELSNEIPFIGVGLNEVVTITFTIHEMFMGGMIINDSEISSADDDNNPNNTPPTDVDSTPDDNSTPEDTGNNDDTTDTDGGDDQDPEGIMVNQVYDLALIKTLAPGQGMMFNPGDDVVFRITVCNQGTLDANEIEVTDYIPFGLNLNPTHAINIMNMWAAAGSDAVTTWSTTNGMMAGPLVPDACIDIDIALTVAANAPQGMTITNWAEISDDDGDDMDSTADNDDTNDGPSEDNDFDNTNGDEDDHDPEPIMINFFDLALTKTLATGQPSMIMPGDNVTYTITVYNQGTIPADNIEVTDYLPACIENADPDWMGPLAGPVTYTLTVANGDLPVGGLAPGGQMSVDHTVKILLSANSMCDLTNWAEISDQTDEDGNPIDDIDSDTDNDPDNDDFGGDDVTDGTNGDEDDHDPEVVELLPYDLALTKDLAVGQASAVMPGDQITYDITVVNQGMVNAYMIEVTDYIPDCMMLDDADWTLDNGNAVITLTTADYLPAGGLLPGDDVSVELTLLLDNPVDPNCDMTNRAEISDDDGDDTDSDPDDDDSNDPPGEDDIDEVPIELLEYDLALTKDLAVGQASAVMPGDQITYDITVINQGFVNAYMIEVTDYIPDCMMLDDADWTLDNGNAVITLTTADYLPAGGLLPGDDVSIELTLLLDNPVDPNCDMTNWAEISDDDGDDVDSDPDNDDSNDPPGEDDIDDVPIELLDYDLALTKDLAMGQAGAVAPGDQVTYDITVVNQGMVNAYMIEVTDYIPECMTLDDPDWTLENGNAVLTMTTADYLPATGLLPGQVVSVELTLLLDNPVAADCDLTNWAEISEDDGDDIDSDPDDDDSNDPPGEDDIDDVPLELLEFDLALAKDLAVGQSSVVMVGDDITYTFTVVNQGDIPADNIEITDYIPGDFLLNDPDWAGPPTGPATITLSVANMALPVGGLLPGEQVMVDITLMIEMTAVEGATYVNGGEISDHTDEDGDPQEDRDSDPDDDPTNDPPGEDDIDDEPVTIMGNCDLAQIKQLNNFDSNGDGTGGLATFDIIVMNQGGCYAYNVLLVDYMRPGLTLNDPDWYVDPFNGHYYMNIEGPIPPGETEVVTITFDVDFFDPLDPQFNFSEIVKSEDFNGDEQMDRDSDPDDQPSNDGPPTDDEFNNENDDEDDHDLEELEIMDLALDKTLVTEGPYSYGQLLEFEICITNEGNATASMVTVTDNIPAGMTFTPGGVNAAWMGSGTQVTHTFPGPFEQGDMLCESIFMTLTSMGMSVEDYTNVAEITEVYDEDGEMTDEDWDSTPDNDDGDQSEDDEDAELVEIYDLAMTKTTTNDGPFEYGDNLVFDITVYNQGTLAAYNVDLIDYIPCGYDYVNSSGWVYNSFDNTATTTIAGPIMPFTNEVIQLTLRLKPCADEGAWRNYSEITGGEDENGEPGEDIDSNPDDDPDNDAGGTPDSDEDDHIGDDGMDSDGDGIADEDDHDPHEPRIFDLALIKQVPAGPGPYFFGDIVEYVITVCNQGNVEANTISVLDYIPAGLSFVSGSNPDWSYDAASSTAEIVLFDGAAAGDGLLPGVCVPVSIFMEVVPADETSDWINYAEITEAYDDEGEEGEDADSDPDSDPDNDDYIDDELDDPDDEDDHDGEEIIVASDLGDHVWKDLDGDGKQDPGEPGVSGVEVRLYTCDGTYVGTEYTDMTGYYLFEMVIPGDYYLEFDISGLPPGCDFTLQDRGGDNEADSDVNLDGVTDCFTMAGVDRFDLDAGLIPLGCIGRCVWHDLDGDGIQDAGEPGIENSRVELYNAGGSLMAITYTDAQGRYIFDELRPGQYYLKFETPNGFSGATTANSGNNDNLDSDVDDSNGPGTTTRIRIDAGECDESVYAGYYKCVPLGDLIWFDADGDNVQDPNENGVNNVKIKIYRLDDGVWGYYDKTYSGHKPGTGSDDGYWKICVPPGMYYLEYIITNALAPVDANMGGNDELDSDVTGFFGANTTDSFLLRSGDVVCDIDAGYVIAGNSTPERLTAEIPLEPRDIGIPKGSMRDKNIELNWVAFSEADGDEGYLIEKRTPTGDYLEIGRVMTRGTSEKVQEYTFTDYDVATGDNEYKVSIITGVDGESEILGGVIVNYAPLEYSVKLYPNITSDIANLVLEISDESQLNVSLFDVNGNLILMDFINETNGAGTYEYKLDTDMLTPATYILKIRVNDKVTTEKLIKIAY